MLFIEVIIGISIVKVIICEMIFLNKLMVMEVRMVVRRLMLSYKLCFFEFLMMGVNRLLFLFILVLVIRCVLYILCCMLSVKC